MPDGVRRQLPGQRHAQLVEQLDHLAIALALLPLPVVRARLDVLGLVGGAHSISSHT